MKTATQPFSPGLSVKAVYDRVREQPMTVILDSSLVGEEKSFSIIGLRPYLILTEDDGVAYENGEMIAESFESRLAAYLAQNYEENDTGLPLIGGGLGYFGYDYGRKFENIPSRHRKTVDMPEALFCFYENFLICDHQSGEWTATARGVLSTPEASFQWLKRLLFSTSDSKIKETQSDAEMNYNFSRDAYEQAVSRMIGHIVAGDIYIANMTQQLRIKSDLSPYALFSALREKNPAPFGAYCHYGDFQIVSASPERFLRMKDRRIETKPIKGTRKRGTTPEEDQALRRELENSEKDKSELLMIVDLERNDLNRICVPGSVKVTKHFELMTFATVFHLVTTVVGELRPEIGFDALLRAMFPGGSITGAPKIEAMKIIDDLEESARGLYTGSLGYLSFNGDCDFNIVIRTAVYRGNCYHIGVGGGITAESDPAFEYEETLQKARAFLNQFQTGGRDDQYYAR